MFLFVIHKIYKFVEKFKRESNCTYPLTYGFTTGLNTGPELIGFKPCEGLLFAHEQYCWVCDSFKNSLSL